MQRQLQRLREDLAHLLALVAAQKARVDKDAVQALAQGAAQKCGHHRGVDAAAERTDDLGVRLDPLLQQLQLLVHEGRHGPVGVEAGDAE